MRRTSDFMKLRRKWGHVGLHMGRMQVCSMEVPLLHKHLSREFIYSSAQHMSAVCVHVCRTGTKDVMWLQFQTFCLAPDQLALPWWTQASLRDSSLVIAMRVFSHEEGLSGKGERVCGLILSRWSASRYIRRGRGVLCGNCSVLIYRRCWGKGPSMSNRVTAGREAFHRLLLHTSPF